MPLGRLPFLRGNPGNSTVRQRERFVRASSIKGCCIGSLRMRLLKRCHDLRPISPIGEQLDL